MPPWGATPPVVGLGWVNSCIHGLALMRQMSYFVTMLQLFHWLVIQVQKENFLRWHLRLIISNKLPLVTYTDDTGN